MQFKATMIGRRSSSKHKEFIFIAVVLFLGTSLRIFLRAPVNLFWNFNFSDFFFVPSSEDQNRENEK